MALFVYVLASWGSYLSTWAKNHGKCCFQAWRKHSEGYHCSWQKQAQLSQCLVRQGGRRGCCWPKEGSGEQCASDLHQIEYLATDAPSMKLLEELKETLPNLVGMSLDLVRLAMHSESASARKRTAGSATLCTCLAEFGHSKSMPPPATWVRSSLARKMDNCQLASTFWGVRLWMDPWPSSKARKILDCLGKRQSRTALDGSSQFACQV